MKLNEPEELREHLPVTNKKGFYALYNFKDDILYTVDYFDGKKFKCWLQIHLSGPEMGWRSYGAARFKTPLSFNFARIIYSGFLGKIANTLFFYLGE